jgi:hypothetical protein
MLSPEPVPSGLRIRIPQMMTLWRGVGKPVTCLNCSVAQERPDLVLIRDNTQYLKEPANQFRPSHEIVRRFTVTAQSHRAIQPRIARTFQNCRPKEQ